jgi:hypothetical protein
VRLSSWGVQFAPPLFVMTLLMGERRFIIDN